jgi:ribosomal protein L7/L12
VGDLSYRIDPAKIDVGRQETLSQIEFFNRILKELERREALRRQTELDNDPEDQAPETFTIQLLSVGNKVKAATVIAKQFEIPVSEALSSLRELPIILAEGATLDQANAFKVALDAARAEVKIIDESQ